MKGVIEKVKTSLLPPLGGGGALIVFRFAFGIMMFLSLVRFAANGWIDALYIQPKFFFTFYGFEWIKPLSATGMYAVFAIMMLASLFVAFGFFYRISIITFFLLFTYVELIDKTNYLNHYYFISLLSFLMCFLPANLAGFKNLRGLRGFIFIIQLQMATVYFFAGIAKINSDWLLHAMPLKIWLASKSNLPLIGNLLTEEWVAYAFSWCGMLFDVSIAFFLFNRKTVWYAYAVVVVFHTLTAILFPGIGMFPYIMMVCATVFLAPLTPRRGGGEVPQNIWNVINLKTALKTSPIGGGLVGTFFLIQFALPFRYLLYPENLFWHEQGFRFSWRVMLMEKAGTVFFTVRNADGKLFEVNNRDFLTMQQEKQMSTQPDMILQFAHHLADVYQSKEVYAEAYVALNGRASQLLIDPKQNLCEVQDGFANKSWITSPALVSNVQLSMTKQFSN
ncbi:MAG: HTTM domain-containing protein [Chitinophagales bacterium]|nr:HTTM domain-containing protein [Chitinophagales bacterium]